MLALDSKILITSLALYKTDVTNSIMINLYLLHDSF